ncbi:hypothetical protein CROQUDRAFT_87780 [Cronartium quercuum f. sp. fusiforme G11]|uniref:Uncharacterized protein n=1 Tax=Cronartium quercuum f. sp. fusiforme G11 TaxID=708437 RepID=A0A9P6TGC1_9BASI|nr:hypothetical protein CROQUDRAFT_87780 [Cronartium quercuum f. sp. fusiforme G11]
MAISGLLNPGNKTVSVLVPGTEGLEQTSSRLHWWNISVPVNITHLHKHTSPQLDISMTELYSAGLISAKKPTGDWTICRAFVARQTGRFDLIMEGVDTEDHYEVVSNLKKVGERLARFFALSRYRKWSNGFIIVFPKTCGLGFQDNRLLRLKLRESNKHKLGTISNSSQQRTVMCGA